MMNLKSILGIMMTIVMTLSLAGCQLSEGTLSGTTNSVQVVEETSSSDAAGINEEADTIITSMINENSILDVTEMFSNRDLEQEPDMTEATLIDLESNQTYLIDEEGLYIISGEASETSIIVEADDEAKVQLILDGVTIVNERAPAIYVKSGDKVFLTTTDSSNILEVTGSFSTDEDVKPDAVIFSKSDLVLNGLGRLEITSSQGNGITSKDDLKITGGTYVMTCEDHGLEANDSIRIYDGDLTLVTDKDGLHSENDDDASLGYIYIQEGNLTITAEDDAIFANSVIQIDGGTINIPTCTEGIEATQIMINDGIIDIYSTDDGINATPKSDLDVLVEVNGGSISIVMASGDTDGFDSNGDLTINGGTIDVTGGSTFDVDGTAELNGGTVIVNGETVTELPASQMGGRDQKRN